MNRKKYRWQRWLLKGVKFTLVCGLLISLLSLAGFAQQKVEIVWSEWWDQEWGVENVDWIISAFEEDHPNVKVTKMYTPWPNMFDKLISLAAAGNPPDVIAMEVDWFQAFERLGVIENLDARLAKSPDFRANLPDVALVSWQGNTKLIYLYAMSGAWILVYFVLPFI